MSTPEQPPTTVKKRLVWLERGFYLVAAACIVLYGIQWFFHRERTRLVEPTGEIMTSLETADRIPPVSPPAKDCNVLVITVDTTRADHLGCYGHRGVKTPVMDALAQKGVMFANAFTTSPSTLPSHSTILTGLYPCHHGARANGSFKVAPENTTLAEILSAEGYATAAFISAYVLDGRFGLDQGFDLYDDDLSKGVKLAAHCFRERPAQYTNESAISWLETVKDRKFFAWIHYFDPHAPYFPPEPFREQYADRPYDGEIAYMDFEIGRLLAGLEALGVLDNTLVVLVGDHGEGLGEHGEQTHSLLIYDSTLHVPLIIVPPTKEPLGLAVNRQVSNADIVPTILDIAGIDSDLKFDGVSLLKGPEAHPKGIFVETIATLVLHGWSPLFGVRQQDGKYIHAPRPEFYDLEDDPKELNNLFEEQPKRVVALANELEGFVGNDLFGAEAMRQMVTMDDQTAKKLAALGYVGTQKQDAIDPEAAARWDPKDMVPHFERIQHASDMMATGQFAEALKELEECLEKVPNDVWTLQLLASAYLERGNLDRAEEVTLHALDLQEDEPGLYLKLAQVSISRGRIAEAEQFLLKSLDKDPQFAPAYVSLASLYDKTGRRDEAMKLFATAIEMDPGSTGPLAYNSIGNGHLARMDIAAAREAFTKSLELDQLNGNAHAGLAAVLIEEGKIDEAEKELEIAVRFVPTNRRVLSTLAAVHNKKGDHEKSLKYARQALEVDPTFPRALNALGSALRGVGDLDGAKDAFEKALEQHADFVPCIINLAQVYLAEHREEKAAGLYRRVLEINPTQPMALFNMGTFKANHNQLDEALDYYRRAVAADPQYAIAHMHLGMLLSMRGMPAEALYHLERSLELEPDQPERERVAQVIAGLRNLRPTSRPQLPPG